MLCEPAFCPKVGENSGHHLPILILMITFGGNYQQKERPPLGISWIGFVIFITLLKTLLQNFISECMEAILLPV
jgi:hypothetical protein